MNARVSGRESLNGAAEPGGDLLEIDIYDGRKSVRAKNRRDAGRELVRLVVETLTDTNDVEKGLAKLAHRFLDALLQPDLLRLRRLVIANADRFPEVGRGWYEQGFERVLATLSTCFKDLAHRKLLRLDDPHLAANHFVGLLLWIPLNKAMFTGSAPSSSTADHQQFARTAVRAFLSGYGPTGSTGSSRLRQSEVPVRRT